MEHLGLICHLFGGTNPLTIRDYSVRDYWALRCWAVDYIEARKASSEE